MNSNLITQIDTAIEELRSLLTVIDGGQITDKLIVTPSTDQLTHFNQDFQARKVATTVIEPDELRQSVHADTTNKLINLLAISDELKHYPVDNLQSINLDRADARYNHKTATANLISRRLQLFAQDEVEKGTPANAANPIPTETWIPLQTLKNKSVGELTRIVLRTIPIDEQLDSDITDLFAGLLQGAETDPDILPTVEGSGLDRSYNGLAELATSQIFRDAVGPALASLLHSLIENEAIAAYEEPFRTAYDAALQFVTAQALATPRPLEAVGQAFITPATLPPAGGPINTSAPTTLPLPTGQAGVDNQAQPTGGQAPTVDFRHPTTPAVPDPSKVKPLNLP